MKKPALTIVALMALATSNFALAQYGGPADATTNTPHSTNSPRPTKGQSSVQTTPTQRLNINEEATPLETITGPADPPALKSKTVVSPRYPAAPTKYPALKSSGTITLPSQQARPLNKSADPLSTYPNY